MNNLFFMVMLQRLHVTNWVNEADTYYCIWLNTNTQV